MLIESRQYQTNLNSAVKQSWDMGNRNVLMVLGTGGGKTVCLSSLVHEEPGAVCVIAHRQELVTQISVALARNGIVHRIIGPKKLIDMVIKMHMIEVGQVFYNAQSHVAVAGVDTLIRRTRELKSWLPSVKLWVVDECFSAGTMVDNKCIENIKVGDYVTSFNEKTGTYHKRKVTNAFKNVKPKYMVRLETESHHVVESTLNHPYWTKRGWINADDLTIDDEVLIYDKENIRCNRLFHVWKTSTTNLSFKIKWKKLLQQGMFKEICKFKIFRNHDKNKFKICQRTNEEKQSNEKRSESQKNGRDIKTNWASTKSSWWQWSRSNETRKNVKKITSRVWFQITNNCKNWLIRSYEWLTQSLQSGLWSQGIKDSNRSRWFKSFIIKPSGARLQKRQGSYWVRVDSTKIFKSEDNGRTSDGFVYNIEVDEHHTYIANGITVHNCHHLQKNNKWGTAVEMFPNARGLGVTATPLRSDGGGLGADNDGEFHDMVVSELSPRGLINQGFLTDYRIFSPANDTTYDESKISKTTGDYSNNYVGKVVAESSLIKHSKSTVTGDVVNSYLKFAKGKLGVTFVPTMEIGYELERQYNDAGVPAILVNAKTPADERADILRRFARREYLQLINVDLFGEGFDLPAIEVISMVRKTQSYGLFVQMFGRVLRLLIDKSLHTNWDHYTAAERLHAIATSTKKYGIIIDHVNNVIDMAAKYGLPDSPRDWSLERRDKRAKSEDDENVIPLKACPECTGVYERYRKACPHCGHIPEPAKRSGPEYVDGDLSELSPEVLAAMRGEVEKADSPIDEQIMNYRQELLDHYCKPMHIRAHCNKKTVALQHQHDSQLMLRDKLAWWAGYRRSEGISDDEIKKMFYLKYDIDWLSAQALPGKDADILIERIGEVN